MSSTFIKAKLGVQWFHTKRVFQLGFRQLTVNMAKPKYMTVEAIHNKQISNFKKTFQTKLQFRHVYVKLPRNSGNLDKARQLF